MVRSCYFVNNLLIIIVFRRNISIFVEYQNTSTNKTMAKIGYLYRAEEDNTFDEVKEWMDEYGCVRVMIEEPSDEKLRPRWKQLLELLEQIGRAHV